MKLYPPAKINLSLRVLGRRPDGYHEVETLITRVTLEDSLQLELTSEGKVMLECSESSIPCDSTNLAVIAATAYLRAAGSDAGVHMVLKKQIPHGAGLGGGSSDAASVLLGLDALHDGCLGRSSLTSIAAQIGSDVPFFLGQGAALCRGRGEISEPVRFLGMEQEVLLVKPPFPVSTHWAYSHWETARKVPGLPYDPQPSPWGELRNDLELPVFEKFPFLGLVKRWLLKRPEIEVALMSGSGSTIFAVLHESATPKNLVPAISEEFGPHLWISHCKTRFVHRE